MLNRIHEAFKAAFFPRRCLNCNSFLKASPNEWDRMKGGGGPFDGSPSFDRVMAPFICPGCAGGFLPVEPPVCTRCGAVFKSREGENHRCGECIAAPKWFRTARSLGVYDGILLSVIHCFKYRGKIQLARPLGLLLLDVFFRFWIGEGIDAVVPVPLHQKRFRQRGFNQAYLLVRQWPSWGEAMEVEQPVPGIARRLIVRNRWTAPQTGLGRKEREVNIKNAFAVPDPDHVKNRRLLLVDDVYTTGATVNACAKVLVRAGARRVDVLTVARAL